MTLVPWAVVTCHSCRIKQACCNGLLRVSGMYKAMADSKQKGSSASEVSEAMRVKTAKLVATRIQQEQAARDVVFDAYQRDVDQAVSHYTRSSSDSHPLQDPEIPDVLVESTPAKSPTPPPSPQPSPVPGGVIASRPPFAWTISWDFSLAKADVKKLFITGRHLGSTSLTGGRWVNPFAKTATPLTKKSATDLMRSGILTPKEVEKVEEMLRALWIERLASRRYS